MTSISMNILRHYRSKQHYNNKKQIKMELNGIYFVIQIWKLTNLQISAMASKKNRSLGF